MSQPLRLAHNKTHRHMHFGRECHVSKGSSWWLFRMSFFFFFFLELFNVLFWKTSKLYKSQVS